MTFNSLITRLPCCRDLIRIPMLQLVGNRPQVSSGSADMPLIRHQARKIGVFGASVRADIGILERSTLRFLWIVPGLT